MLLSNNKLDKLLGELKAIKHVQFVRIGSRIPVFLPQRIDSELCEIFKKQGPVWLSIHTNHPNECTDDLRKACERLAFAGVPIGNQSVLLKGINNQAEIMRTLIHKLLMMRVRPYYLYQCDLINGSAHLRTDPRENCLNSIPTGPHHWLCHSTICHRCSWGGGKIPINPNYIESITEHAIIMKNYEGKTYQYPLHQKASANSVQYPDIIEPMLT